MANRFLKRWILFLTFWACLAIGAISYASMPEITGSANVYLTNNYFWRVAGDGDPHLQYSFSLSTSVKNLEISLSPWTSHDLSDMEVDEVDYILDLSYAIADFSANLGWLYYDVTGIEETSEVYLGLGYSIGLGEKLGLSPGIKFYYDIDEIKKTYFEASISADAQILEPLSASIASTIGYDMGQFIDSGVTVLQFGVSLSYQIMDKVSLTPGFTYVLGLDDSFENDQFIGLSIDFEF